LFVTNALAFFNNSEKVLLHSTLLSRPLRCTVRQQCHKTLLRMNYNTFSELQHIYPYLMFAG
jgi:hypothetical protein